LCEVVKSVSTSALGCFVYAYFYFVFGSYTRQKPYLHLFVFLRNELENV
jgi:hypothetical protein